MMVRNCYCLLLFFAIVTKITYSEELCRNVQASVGEQLVFTCNIIICSNGSFQWFILGESGNQSLSGSDSTYTVNVTTVEDFGGQTYQCQCAGMSKCFIVWVRPVITLTFTNSTIEVGTRANVTCIAESYPSANSSEYFSIQHPIGITIYPIHFIADMDVYGAIHPIESTSCEDSGPYACHVQVGNEVSNDKTATFTVYESGTQCMERTPSTATQITLTSESTFIPVPTSATSTTTQIPTVTSTFTPPSSTCPLTTSTLAPSLQCGGCQDELLGLGVALGSLIIAIVIKF